MESTSQTIIVSHYITKQFQGQAKKFPAYVKLIIISIIILIVTFFTHMHTLTHTHTHTHTHTTHTHHYATLHYITLLILHYVILHYITSNSIPTSKTKDSQLLLNVIEMFSLESQGVLRLKGGDIVALW